eukprot:scaffold127101_cov22-Tisochrysis_lutea.AAC.3
MYEHHWVRQQRLEAWIFQWQRLQRVCSEDVNVCTPLGQSVALMWRRGSSSGSTCSVCFGSHVHLGFGQQHLKA